MDLTLQSKSGHWNNRLKKCPTTCCVQGFKAQNRLKL